MSSPAAYRIRQRRPPATPIPATNTTHSKSKLIEQLEQTYDTPPNLRDLERGWRARRKVLADVTVRQAQRDIQTSLDRFIPRIPPPVIPSANTGVRFDVSIPSALPTPPSTPTLSPKELHKSGPDTHFEHRPHTVHLSEQGPLFTNLRPAASVTKNAPVPIRPKAILAYPLPPTPHPVALPGNSKATICVPCSISTYELIIKTKAGTIRIGSGGEIITFINFEGKGRTSILSEYGKWTEEQKQEWEIIGELVEKFKRCTPRAKFFDPLGHLTITCSSPPDIILAFHRDIESFTKVKAKATVNGQMLKVRLVYSRNTHKLLIDTSYVSPPVEGKKLREKLRTKRLVPLPLLHVDKGDDELGLGITDDMQMNWLEDEKEGLKRLVALSRIWRLWDGL